MEERIFHRSMSDPEKIAVFDLDGTLLAGDIGDVVFASLLLDGHRLGLTWSQYKSLLYTHKSQAYRGVVQAMAGLDAETVLHATAEVMRSGKRHLTIQSDHVPVPRPRPAVAELVSFLHDRQYQVYVISASNHISVRLISREWFGIPETHSFGIQTRIHGGKLTSDLLEPVPIGAGKVSLFRLIAGNSIPLIMATDSRIDLPLVNYTHPLGVSFWIGDNHVDFKAVLENSRTHPRFCFVDIGSEIPQDNF
jgi:phosphoserine phosphatase